MGFFSRGTGLLPVLILLLLFCAVNHAAAKRAPRELPRYASFEDIPGVTEEEKAAIRALRADGKVFIHAADMTTECFPLPDGSVGGFSSLFCRWLSDLFGIRFEPAILEWGALIAGLASHSVDFTGELTATPERRATYFMTGPIATRTVKQFRLTGSAPLKTIAKTRPLRLGFLSDSTVRGLVGPHVDEGFTAVMVADCEVAYTLLQSGALDAFFEDGPTEAAFDAYSNVETVDFFPLLYNPVSLSTQNPELAPVISVVQKYLDQGASYQLVQLYNQGHQQYLRNKLFQRLTEEEKTFIRERLDSGEAVRVGFEFDNYPVCFYNREEEQWQGIALDALREISRLTGLAFVPAHDRITNWSVLLAELERGDLPMLSELLRSEDREGRFLWPRQPFFVDSYALLSRSDYPDINLNEILYSHVGLIKASAYAEAFRKWFPSHTGTTELPDTFTAFDALERGDIDLLMAPRGTLLSATNYMERPGFKVNLPLKNSYESYFGFNKDQRELRSIVSKALELVDTQDIAEGWMRRVFDYRGKLAREQVPYLIGLSVLMASVLILLSIMLAKNRQMGRKLEATVRERTRELEVQTTAAQVASQAKSEFLANMSHEIRTPLNAIIGFGDLELRKDHPGETRSNLIKIHDSGTILLSIINDILDISKIESGHFELVPVDYDTAGLIHDTVSLNMVRIGDKPVRFLVDVNEDLPDMLHGDELRVKQILNNLLSNAFKYTREGEVELTVRHEPISPDSRDIWLIFAVRDTGIGIREEDREALFTKYSQLDTRANRHIEGTGLGLAIAGNLAALMQGGIKVDSEYGKGSVFTLRLRQSVADGRPIGPETAEALRQCRLADVRRKRNMTFTPTRMPYGHVLLVDDVSINLDVAEGMLAPYELAVDRAASGAEAVELVRSGATRYDVIFMDHMMPGMDGIEAVRIIREEINSDYARAVPIIALTANALAGSREMFLENGFQGFLAKPIDSQEMDAALNRWVRDRRRL